jgi:hypothetical protein
MNISKAPTEKDPLALTYTDKDIRRMIETCPAPVRMMIFFIHEHRGNSCQYSEFKSVLASHSVKDKEFTELLEYVTSKKLMHMGQAGSQGTMITLTDNAKAVLAKITGTVIK